jgi:hypothetical protein
MAEIEKKDRVGCPNNGDWGVMVVKAREWR